MLQFDSSHPEPQTAGRSSDHDAYLVPTGLQRGRRRISQGLNSLATVFRPFGVGILGSTLGVCALAGLGAAAGAQPAPPTLPVTVKVPNDGLLSLGLYDSTNKLIRALSYAKPVTAGNVTLNWDGTTDLGLPAAPGPYHAKGIWFPQGPQINFKMKVGESGDPPYFTPDGTGGWGANLGGPEAVCSNSKNVLAAFGCIESQEHTGVQMMDPTGKIVGQYNTFFGWDVRLASTMDENNLYLAIAAFQSQKLVIGKYDLGNPHGKILATIPTAAHSNADGRWKGRWTTNVIGLALQPGRLYVPVTPDDTLFIVNTSDGSILSQVSIPSPRGIVAIGNGLAVLSGKQLLRLDEDGKVTGTIVSTGLDEPAGLAVDAKGNFYVADDGTAQQVKVFDPNGKFLHAIGKEGGRPREGNYDPSGLLDPRGICIGPDGNVWVASPAEDFQRLSEWSPDGKLVREFFNMRISAGQGQLTPDRTQMLTMWNGNADAPGVTAYNLDWKNSKWYPAWHFDTPESEMKDDSVLIGNNHVFGQLATSWGGEAMYLSPAGTMVQGDNGKLYLAGGDYSIYVFDPKTASAKLASLIYTHRVTKLADGRYQGLYDTGPNNWMTWSDTNGDGKMALDETRYTANPPLLNSTQRLADFALQPDLSVLMLAPSTVTTPAGTKPTWTVFRLKPEKVLDSGVPVYDWNDLEKVVDLQVPDFHGGDGTKGPSRVQLSDLRYVDGSYYVQAQPGASGPLHLTGIDGDTWWASRNWRMTLLKFDPVTGAPAWVKMGRRAPAKALPGEMYYPGYGIAGKSGRFIFEADTLGVDWVWTDDGLYVGKLYHGPGQVILDADSIFVESTGSHVYNINGTTYALTGDNGVSVHEVVLPTLADVDGGTVQLTPALAAAARPWDPDGPAPGARPSYVARSIFNFDPKVHQAVRHITVDGQLDPAEWSGVTAMPIFQDGKTVATVQAVFDDKNLYLAYKVDDPNGLKNLGSELPYSPFTSGGYVDFDLGPNWSDPDRADPLAGDVRVILARITGGPDYQMGFWPVKPGGSNPQTIVSPAQQRHFDDISPVPGLQWAYQVTDTGYIIEVSVPFTSLGIIPARTPRVGFDASVAFANAEGTIRQSAAHWGGQTESRVVDRPGSASLLPHTWGTLEFDRSPLPTVAGNNAPVGPDGPAP